MSPRSRPSTIASPKSGKADPSTSRPTITDNRPQKPGFGVPITSVPSSSAWGGEITSNRKSSWPMRKMSPDSSGSSLESGDIFRIGQELLRFEVISPPQALEDGTEVMGTPNPGFWGRLSVIVGRDVDGSAFPLFGEAIVLGRERGDILFPEDGYVSGTHSRIALHDEHVYLSDLGSSNGTFLRLRHERTVPTGAFMLMGQQLFRLEYR